MHLLSVPYVIRVNSDIRFLRNFSTNAPRVQQDGHCGDKSTSTIFDLLCKSRYQTTRRAYLDDVLATVIVTDVMSRVI